MQVKEILEGWSRLLGASGGNVPSNVEAFLYGINFGEDCALKEAVQYVNDWADPLDSLHEASLKGILHEISDGIKNIE